MKTVFVTGVAGFIGFHAAKSLLEAGFRVIGIDNLNDYYDVTLKEARLSQLVTNSQFLHYIADIGERSEIENICKSHQEITHVLHLAAQAGVRYSLENPFAYVHSNLIGHMVILECCRNFLPNLENFVYASSSSVYGAGNDVPYDTDDKTDSPLSLYAATKKSNELLSYSYSHLYGIPSTGLRFFTVYGPWGRPDMAMFLFTKAILSGEPITLFNNGKMRRDFTYIDDIISGTLAALWKKTAKKNTHKIYNLGNNKPVDLSYFVTLLEENIGKKAKIKYAEMHPGDMQETYAEIKHSCADLDFTPKTSLAEGIPKFVRWYREYYNL
jgi:UDP-glucuronate 4-epimerase